MIDFLGYDASDIQEYLIDVLGMTEDEVNEFDMDLLDEQELQEALAYCELG